MRMSNFIVKDAIIPSLAATTKEAAIRELVQSLHEAGHLQTGDIEDVIKAILRREQVSSTGIGRNIAIPHTKHLGVDRPIGTMALSSTGIPFDSIDGHPVHIMVMLISPMDRPGDHLRALENVVRTMKDEDFIKSLRLADTRQKIWDLIDDAQPPWDH
jgi:PTS system fructose-specific IIA component/PTS system nitrogen regulatory IIA component